MPDVICITFFQKGFHHFINPYNTKGDLTMNQLELSPMDNIADFLDTHCAYNETSYEYSHETHIFTIADNFDAIFDDQLAFVAKMNHFACNAAIGLIVPDEDLQVALEVIITRQNKERFSADDVVVKRLLSDIED
jgi:hypothetical protein